MILDVGCGDRPTGDVNVDLRIQPRLWAKDSKELVNVKTMPNFVMADASKLPFSENSFDVVKAFHLLEHCLQPIEVLKEFHRVCESATIIKVPSALHHRDQDLQHYYSWTPNALQHLCREVFPKVRIYSTKYTLRKAQNLHALLSRAMYRIFPPYKFVFRVFFEKWRHMVYSPEITAICYKNISRN